jgi:hypothetical protein
MGKIHVVEFNDDASVVASGVLFYLSVGLELIFSKVHTMQLSDCGISGEFFPPYCQANRSDLVN